MKYIVTGSFITNCVTEVEANNSDEAYRIALAMDGKDFMTTEIGDWKVRDILLSDSNFTKEQIAFMNAYENVGPASREIVKTYLLTKNDDHFSNDHSEYYSALTDARVIWEHAKDFYFKETT